MNGEDQLQIQPETKSASPLRRLGQGVWSSPVQGALLFGLLGPPLGAWSFWIAIAAVTGMSGDGLQWHGVLSALPASAAFAYLMATPPAVFAGVVAGLMRGRGRLRRVRACLLVALIAMVLATFYGAWEVGGGMALAMFGAPGFVSGFCCALIFRALGCRREHRGGVKS